MWRIVGTDRFGFTTSTAGTVYTPLAGPAEAGDVDVLFVQGETTFATPAGWTLPLNGSLVQSMGAYAFVRTAQAGDEVTATLVASLNGYQAALSWVRVKGAAGLEVVTSTAAESAGTGSGLVASGPLAQRGGLVLSAALLQTGGTGSGSPTAPVWLGGTAIDGASGSVGPVGPTQMSAFVGARFYVDVASQQLGVEWTNPMGLRYLFQLVFAPANPPQTLFAAEQPTSPDVSDGSPLTVGEVMRSAVPGRVVGILWRTPNGPVSGGTVTAGIYTITSNTTGVQQRVQNFGDLRPGEWCASLLYDPLGVNPDGSYQVAAGELFLPTVWTPHRYVASNGFHAAEVTRGDLTAIADGQPYSNGRFQAGGAQNSFPDANFGSSSYFVDVLFVPDPPPTVPTETTGRTELGVTAAAVATKQVSVSANTSLGFVAGTQTPGVVVTAGDTSTGFVSSANATKQVTAGGTTYLGLFSAAGVIDQPVVRAAFTALGLLPRAATARKHLFVGAGTYLGLRTAAPAALPTGRPVAGPAWVRVTSTASTIRITSPPG